MPEEWRPVAGWDYYEVSSLGRVRSLDKVVAANGGGVTVKHGKVLKPFPRRGGYRSVRLRDSPRDQQFGVHTLVLETFVGPKPDGLEARHLNGIESDNRAENLAWGTHAENMADQKAHGTHWETQKQACPKGHPYDYIDPKGARRCSVCDRARERERRARRKQLTG